MNIYTSYFSKEKDLITNGILPIAISLRLPKDFKGKSYPLLAPNQKVLSITNNIEYDEQFLKLLELLTPEDVLDNLRSIAGDFNSIALLCYEKPSDYCHRHLVSKWLNDNLQLNIQEYGKKK
jgi:hypothetical protein